MAALHTRHQNLVELLTVSGAAERCRVFGRSAKADELSILNKLPNPRYHIVDEVQPATAK